jgi:hypothetical protein
MPEQPISETVSKLDAARRQLATAIELWFHDKDQVSIHTLSFAAYEVIHSVSRKKGRTQTLIFDSPVVKKEYRGQFSSFVKRTASFFKHGEHDPEGTIEFQPIISEFFIVFAIVGLDAIGISANEYEATFMWWFLFNRPEMLTQEGANKLFNLIPVDAIAELRELSKVEFFKIAFEARRSFLNR